MNKLTKLIKGSILVATTITFSALFLIIGYILIKGIPHIKPSLFTLEYNTENVSLFPAIITTLMMISLSLIIAGPIGIFTGLYLVEYAGIGNTFVKIIRLTTETLSGIPSIVYGLFGLLFFVTTLGWSFSLIAGAFTLSIMILPLIIRATEEALMSVPNELREASFSLGTGRLRTIFRVVLPVATPGILAGVILSIGRIVGETAALIYTAGTVPQIPKNIFSSGRTLAIHMYVLSNEGLYINQAYATAVILLVMVIGINALSSLLANRFVKEGSNG